MTPQNDPKNRQNWPHHIERQREINLKHHKKHQLPNGINDRKKDKIDHITLRDTGKILKKSYKNCNNTSRIKHKFVPFCHFLPNLINFDQFRKVPRTTLLTLLGLIVMNIGVRPGDCHLQYWLS